MKIVSKFKDYYDSALAFGQDSRIPYLRLIDEDLPKEVTRRLDLDTVAPFDLRYASRGFNLPATKEHASTAFNPERIIVAGKVYRALKALVDSTRKWDYREHCYVGEPGRTVYFYTYAEFCKFVEGRGFLVKDIYGDKSLFGGPSIATQAEKFLENQGTTELESFLVEKRLVVVYQRGVEEGFGRSSFPWVHNAPLKDVEFYKFMGAHQVFQELDMYVTGVLGQQAKEMINISDRDRIHQHGFNEYSFRKPPEDKRRKKKQNS